MTSIYSTINVPLNHFEIRLLSQIYTFYLLSYQTTQLFHCLMIISKTSLHTHYFSCNYSLNDMNPNSLSFRLNVRNWWISKELIAVVESCTKVFQENISVVTAHRYLGNTLPFIWFGWSDIIFQKIFCFLNKV